MVYEGELLWILDYALCHQLETVVQGLPKEKLSLPPTLKTRFDLSELRRLLQTDGDLEEIRKLLLLIADQQIQNSEQFFIVFVDLHIQILLKPLATSFPSTEDFQTQVEEVFQFVQSQDLKHSQPSLIEEAFAQTKTLFFKVIEQNPERMRWRQYFLEHYAYCDFVSRSLAIIRTIERGLPPPYLTIIKRDIERGLYTPGIAIRNEPTSEPSDLRFLSCVSHLSPPTHSSLPARSVSFSPTVTSPTTNRVTSSHSHKTSRTRTESSGSLSPSSPASSLPSRSTRTTRSTRSQSLLSPDTNSVPNSTLDSPHKQSLNASLSQAIADLEDEMEQDEETSRERRKRAKKRISRKGSREMKENREGVGLQRVVVNSQVNQKSLETQQSGEKYQSNDNQQSEEVKNNNQQRNDENEQQQSKTSADQKKEKENEDTEETDESEGSSGEIDQEFVSKTPIINQVIKSSVIVELPQIQPSDPSNNNHHHHHHHPSNVLEAGDVGDVGSIAIVSVNDTEFKSRDETTDAGEGEDKNEDESENEGEDEHENETGEDESILTSPPSELPKRKRKRKSRSPPPQRIGWDREEKALLLEGISKYGGSGPWKKLHEEFFAPHPVYHRRSVVAIRTKWNKIQHKAS